MNWIPINDLSRQLNAERNALSTLIGHIADSGWLVQGPEHAAFELELAEYLGVPYVIGLANGTDALELALRAVIPPKRHVVVTAANCGGYTTTAARRAGLKVRYADVDPVTHLLTAQTVAPVLDDSVGVVVVTHLYGRAAAIEPIRTICADRQITVVEDCAQAIGARSREGNAGALADVAAFSFYPTKNLGAVGDAGAIATRSAATAQTVRELRQYGWRDKYTIIRDGGRNSRLDEFQAGVLRRRLPLLDERNARRRDIVTAYEAAASNRLKVLPAKGHGHVAHLAVVVTEDRAALQAHLSRNFIRSDVHYPIPDHKQPAIAAEYNTLQLPATEQLAKQIVTIPVFPELTDSEIELICDALANF